MIDGKTPLFELENISVNFETAGSSVHAVHKVSLRGLYGETVGVVGESGSGKSTLARALLMLEPVSAGKVFFQGVNMGATNPHSLRKLRRHMQLIFQDPDASLNPRRTAAWHLDEVFTTHFPEVSRGEREDRIDHVLGKVQLDIGLKGRYSYELSGGQKQRLAIARALLLSPKLIVLDEPLSSLDAALRKSVLMLLKHLQDEHKIGYLFITHDLSTLGAIATRVAVMYRGVIVELASVDELYQHPSHPYTVALLSCIPIADPLVERERKSVFFPATRPTSRVDIGCPFAHRCPFAKERCHCMEPILTNVSLTHAVACHFPEEVGCLLRALQPNDIANRASLKK
jgi:oligopeptide transport system ATP-binding protein